MFNNLTVLNINAHNDKIGLTETFEHLNRSLEHIDDWGCGCLSFIRLILAILPEYA